MNDLIRLFIRQGWRRGIVEDRKTWLVLGALAICARALQRLGRQKQVVYREVLDVGSGLRISHLPEEWGGKHAD